MSKNNHLFSELWLFLTLILSSNILPLMCRRTCTCICMTCVTSLVTLETFSDE